ncbi:hypothetical protein SAMN05421647_101467 [Marinobacterium stanieri]|uniref:Uncharacterized protein n=1 Tax=Marinobacterium stanieri TaxID=49186 RepID=A0A1N6NPF7_9GAMM|nr:hypothetical protein SAMN05421647_101467 [Marinobacterium stanieri]
MNTIPFIIIVLSFLLLIIYLLLSLFLFFFTVRRIEYNLKINGYDRPFSWDVMGLRTYLYVIDLVQPKRLYSRPSVLDAFTTSKLIHEYKRPIDVSLARLLMLDGVLLFAVAIVSDMLYF